MDRRQILKSSVALAAVSALPSRVLAAKPPTIGDIELKKGDVILFQGDSITDAGRNRKREGNANNFSSLGKGYAMLATGNILAAHSDLNLKIYNRGISGHKVPQLQARWQKDTIDLKPRILSILIGVNDIWHKMNGRYDGTADSYQAGYSKLIATTKKALPNTTIVICEPFALRCGAVKDSWFPEFDQMRAAAAKVAEEHKTVFVPFQSMFDKVIAKGTKPQYWARDGVHPSIAGHALMAKTWRETVGV